MSGKVLFGPEKVSAETSADNFAQMLSNLPETIPDAQILRFAREESVFEGRVPLNGLQGGEADCVELIALFSPKIIMSFVEDCNPDVVHIRLATLTEYTNSY